MNKIRVMGHLNKKRGVEAVLWAEGPYPTDEAEGFEHWLGTVTSTQGQRFAHTMALAKWNMMLSRKNIDEYERYASPKYIVHNGENYRYCKITMEVKPGHVVESWYPSTVFFDYDKFLNDNPNWINEKERRWEDKIAQRSSPSRSSTFKKAGGNF